MILMAAEREGSADPFAVRGALERLEWDGLTAPREFMHPETQQTAESYFLLEALGLEAVAC